MRILIPFLCLCAALTVGFIGGYATHSAMEPEPVASSCANVQALEARERNIDLQQQIIDERQRTLSEEKRRFEEGRRIMRAQALDFMPRLISITEQADAHGEHRALIDEMRTLMTRMQERQNEPLPY